MTGIEGLTEDEAKYLVAAITDERRGGTKRDLRRDVQKLAAEVERLLKRNAELRQLIEDIRAVLNSSGVA
jgi:hypothetical protein